MRRSPQLRTLSSEHHSGLRLAKHALDAATDSSKLAGVWSEVSHRFDAEFEPHFRVEERYLLPSLAQAGVEELVARTLQEHQRLRALAAGGLGREPERLREFGELLRAHIRFEEQTLFPVAEMRLSHETLEAVAAASHNNR